jgi:GDP/UDP-N,N'-diacetylbacillosamine 2-epimerase (hydrolysing)
MAKSVINCDPVRSSIAAALTTLYSHPFQASLKTVRNPYGEGGASAKIVAHIKTTELDGILKKRFYDSGTPCE